MSMLEIDQDLLEPAKAWWTDTELVVMLTDGVRLATPLWWYSSLQDATREQRDRIELCPFGLHWPDLNEDLSVEGMLRGHKYPNAKPPAEAAE